MAIPAIETRDLTVYYGRRRGICGVNLVVESGEVFGFLGPNGAGKTTTQRVLLDIIRPTSGAAYLFGMDSRADGERVRSRVGYLPGELSLYEHMTGHGCLSLLASLGKGRREPAYRDELCERLDLDPSRKIGQYSRGNKQKVGIVAAFMEKPDLVILDEPTTGLDPLVQQTVMDLVRETRADGRTVFLSSHVLQEVQEVCDRVGIVRSGELVQTERVQTLTSRNFKRLKIVFASAPPEDAFNLEGVTELSRSGGTVNLEVRKNLAEVLGRSATLGVVDVDTVPVTLEEVFLALYGKANGGVNG